MAEELSIHGRVSRLEEWKDQMQTIDLPSMRETIRREIPEHYTKRIAESEGKMILQLGSLIDAKLDRRFGWMSRGIEAIVTSVIVALILYGLRLL